MRQTGVPADSRFERLNAYLAADPTNLSLLEDAATAAWEEGRVEAVETLVRRYAAVTPPPPSLTNLLGLAALAQGRAADAAMHFESLLAATPDDPALRLNLAWAREQLADYGAVLDLVGPLADTAQGATLAVRALHHLGRLEDAIAVGDAWEGRPMGDAASTFWGVAACAALDAEDLARAGRWAAQGEASAEGLATLGMLALVDARSGEAEALFDQAVALRPDLARGRLGLGALRLEQGRPDAAAVQFEAAAGVFNRHLGTWVAAGWARLLAGDMATARAHFERALALDDTFSETHGGLAVLELLAGDEVEAKRRADIAVRLDRYGLGGTLAHSLLLEKVGKAEAAARIREAVLNAPIGVGGQSIAGFMAQRAARGG